MKACFAKSERAANTGETVGVFYKYESWKRESDSF